MLGGHEVALGPMTVIGLRPPDAVGLAAELGYDRVGIKIDGPPERLPFPLLSDPALVTDLRRRLDDAGTASSRPTCSSSARPGLRRTWTVRLRSRPCSERAS